MNSQLTTTELAPKPMKLKPKQRKVAEYYYNPDNKETFGNLRESALLAGYTETYARSLNRDQQWLEQARAYYTSHFEPTHIIRGVEAIAHTSNRDETRLRAYEVLAKLKGMYSDTTTTVNIVQPILNAQSIQPTIIDQEPTE